MSTTPDPLDGLIPAVRDAAVNVAVDTDSVFVSRKGTALAVDGNGDVWHVTSEPDDDGPCVGFRYRRGFIGTLVARKVERG